MRLTIPLTGTVLVEGSAQGDLVGDNQDPIRPIDIDLGHVSWTMVNIDLKNEVMVIEIKPAEVITEDTGVVDVEGLPICTKRKTTEEEKIGFLQYAQHLIENHAKDELYQMSGCLRLKRPFKDKK